MASRFTLPPTGSLASWGVGVRPACESSNVAEVSAKANTGEPRRLFSFRRRRCPREVAVAAVVDPGSLACWRTPVGCLAALWRRPLRGAAAHGRRVNGRAMANVFPSALWICQIDDPAPETFCYPQAVDAKALEIQGTLENYTGVIHMWIHRVCTSGGGVSNNLFTKLSTGVTMNTGCCGWRCRCQGLG